VTGVPALPPCGAGSCVSTQAQRTDPLRRIEPLAFAGAADKTMRRVLRALERVPRLRVLERDAVAVHAVARSAWLRVPLDIEVRVDGERARIDLRVATRLALRERARSRTRAEELLALIEAELRAD